MRKLIYVILLLCFYSYLNSADTALQVTSDKEISIYIDNISYGKIDSFGEGNYFKYIQLDPGTYNLKCTYEDYDPYKKK